MKNAKHCWMRYLLNEIAASIGVYLSSGFSFFSSAIVEDLQLCFVTNEQEFL